MFQQFVEIHSMKKFTLKAITLATASVCGSAAFAGSITAPASDAAAVKYAIEALAAPPAAATPIAGVPGITYTMGVSRTTAQDFTIIYNPSSGSTFGACPIAPAAFTIGGTGAATVSNKRSGPNECAYEVDVTTATDTTTTITISGLTFATHNLGASAGNTAGVQVALWDLGESANIDNPSGVKLSRVVAQSGNALTLTAAADTGTTTDVNDELGPLFGFVTANNDGDANASASFSVGNNATGAFVMPDGTTPWDFSTHGTSIAVTVAGNFQGLATNGYTVSQFCGGTNPTATVAGGNATFTLLPANFTCGTGTYEIQNTFTSARTASLGTSRVFNVSAVGDVQTGADRTLSGNASWWTWTANASQLMTPYFTTNSLFLSRFFFLNESASPVQWSAQCFSETGNAITYPSGNATLPTGTLSAAGQTAINASSICSFAGNTRGAVIFTINAPIEAIKGSYQAVDPVSLNNSVTPLTRRYGVGSTTE
jgi:hypothetical protein